MTVVLFVPRNMLPEFPVASKLMQENCQICKILVQLPVADQLDCPKQIDFIIRLLKVSFNEAIWSFNSVGLVGPDPGLEVI